jgi:hypothetical protein
MNTTERALIGALFLVLMALVSWLLGTVSLNIARIAVLEQRADMGDRTVWEIKDDMKAHRAATELGR